MTDRYEYKREWHLKYSSKLKAEVVAAYGGKCSRCGFSDIRALQLDHVNGGGNVERSRGISGLAIYRKARDTNFPAEYQILCANCNWIKRSENNEYGGRRRGVSYPRKPKIVKEST